MRAQMTDGTDEMDGVMDVVIQVRYGGRQREMIRRAARQEMTTMSQWIRRVTIHEARKALGLV